MSNNKLWTSHRIVLPEARQIAVNQCGNCRFFVTIQGIRERRQDCVAPASEGIRLYRSGYRK